MHYGERNVQIFIATSMLLPAFKGMVDRTMRDRLLSFPTSDWLPSLLEFYFGCISLPIRSRSVVFW